MIDHPGPNLYQPPDDRVHGRLDTLAPERYIADHVEQVIGKTSDEKPCLIRSKSMAARLVPSEGVLSLFYPVFNLSTTIVNRNYLVCFKVRVGHNKSDTREELTNMPFYFTDNPSGSVPFLRLVMKLDHPYLNATLWRTTDGSLQVRLDEPLEAVVGGDANEVGDALLFAEFVQIGTGKGCIPPEPELLEPRPVAVDQRRDKLQDAIG